jgi:hypothetical protein
VQTSSKSPSSLLEPELLVQVLSFLRVKQRQDPAVRQP